MYVRSNVLNENISEIVICRPEKRNALSKALMEELTAAIKGAPKGIVLIRGDGGFFCSGLDLKELSDRALPQTFAKLLIALYQMASITIACVEGGAVAGGAGLMSACDFAVVGKGSKIGYPEVHRGIVPAMISGLLLRQLGMRAVRELLLIGEMVPLERALELGLISRLVPKGEAYDAGRRLAEELIAGDLEALYKTKRVIEEMYPGRFEEEVQHALEMHLDLSQGEKNG